MEEDLVVVDDSDLDNGISDERDRVTSEISSSPSPSSAALPKIIGSDIRHTAVRCVPVEVEPKGKTPYTTSVNLKRGPKGYGFSVTWTHPPRIERVEPGLAADLAGMRVADYIVFVGSHNVVKMDEEQVLQLIQAAGDTLTLEIYRKSGNKPSSGCVTSDQLTTAELRSDFQQRQPKSPVNQTHSILANAARKPPAVSHHQPPSAVAATPAVASAATNSRRQVVENVSHNGNPGHVSWYPTLIGSNTLAPSAPLGIHISNAPPLKVAFNKSIGGGVLV
ncbi:uncharacterized protein LOC123470164 [Daphnia magna]|uniref:uncharacterized protein LOC123470164 n=1 Tax=Daphnia magna TaxID=35525 RepID=UPI001E1BA226|nr:uncharacterized protein LOC123470164 [Daphnia magna]